LGKVHQSKRESPQWLKKLRACSTAGWAKSARWGEKISTLLAGTIIAEDMQEACALFFETGVIEQVRLSFNSEWLELTKTT